MSLTFSLLLQNLTVTGVGAGATFGDTVGSTVLAPFNISAMRKAFRPPEKHILENASGNVKAGEMLLVLGRPGSGCTTLLKSLASYRDGYKAVEGEVLYEGLSHKTMEKRLRGELVYAPEDDIHFATLNVGRTIGFAAAARAPQGKVRPGFGAAKNTRAHYVNTMRTVIGTILGLRHTFRTLVGDELIRGVSGGEKKRTSIAEILATRARIMLFDNSTRGLDSSTAFEFCQSLRILTNATRCTTVSSIYQAGEPVYRLFDKVALLHTGKLIYFGPVSEAADYFYNMGYEPHARQTSPDFLVSVTDPHARIVRAGFEKSVPRTAEDFQQRWLESEQGRKSLAEVDGELDRMHAITKEDKKEYMERANQEKAKRAPDGSSFLLSYQQQVWLAIKRRAQIAQGDKATQITLLAASTIQGLINGSVFYQLPQSSASFFSYGGVLFFMMLFQSFLAQTEAATGFMQRPIIVRHRRFAMVRPSADAIANTLLDIPVRFPSTLIFNVALYFMVGLALTADQFFVLLFTVLLVSYTMVAMFRTIAATFSSDAPATAVAGFLIIWFALYAGYVIPRPSMTVWWRWLSYANPIAFGFEILMANQFRRLRVPCATYVPTGPGYEGVADQYRTCTTLGGIPGTNLVDGNENILLSFGYRWSNRFRNVGILFGFFGFFIIAYAVMSELQGDPSAVGGKMIFRRGAKQLKGQAELEQAAIDAEDQSAHGEHKADEIADSKLPTTTDIFAWQNVTYDVPVKGAEKTRRLLNGVSGFVQPGRMTALMGESGAGKTTLLNVLAARTGSGVIRGDFLVNGRPLPASFQAQTGYVQQMDTHLPTQTVREALEFSALLRQSTGTNEEKLAYVEEVIDMLEMRDWTDALVGNVGQGLSVEQRKRLTIAVELCAKPKLLLFLDEPTSGLDSLAAWSIVRFLKKLANAGQSILCTIHQPSAELLSVFDRLILLKKGGEVVYAGDIHGGNVPCAKLVKYFEERSGEQCGDNNPAEFMLDCIGAGAAASSDKDWAKLYLESSLYGETQDDLRKIMARADDPAFDRRSDDKADDMEYAASFWMQFKQVLKRTLIFYWRSPTYIMSKMALNIIGGLFVGSSFYGQGSLVTTASLQNKLFAIFIALVLSTSLSQQLQPVFLQLRGVFEARERPSKIYSWPVLVSTAFIVEMIPNYIGGTLFWIPWQFFLMFSGSRAFVWFIYA